MDNKLLVDFYYEKLREFSACHKTHPFIIKQDFRIKQELSKIVDSNNHNFLIEPVLCYISRHEHIIDTLKKVSNSDLDRLKILIDYFHGCINEVYFNQHLNCGFKRKYLSRKIYDDHKKKAIFSTPYLLLDDITKEKINKAVAYLKYYYGHVVFNSEYIDEILCIVLGYCQMNNAFDEFESMCDTFKLDTSYMVDDFEMQRLDLGDKKIDYLIDRVVYFITSRNQRRNIM